MFFRLLLLTLSLIVSPLLATKPDAIYLTCLSDLSSSMTVHWHTSKESTPLLHYQTPSGWTSATGNTVKLSKEGGYIHKVTLDGLNSDTRYTFRFGEGGQTYWFQTLPSTFTRPITFVDGGDAYYYDYLFYQMNQTIAKLDPDFVVLGGDIAYTAERSIGKGGREWRISRWLTFIKAISKYFVAPNGRLIPLIIGIGNHDILSDKELKGALPFVFDIFAFPEGPLSYRTLDVGDYASIFILDTDHFLPMDGAQTEWLKGALEARKHIPLKFASYHVSAYPTFYKVGDKGPQRVHSLWIPLFEEHNILACFEHHNHCYKRTYPMLSGEIDERGIVYVGDGTWGTPPRPPREAPYLASAAQINAVWYTVLSPSAPPKLTSIAINGSPLETIHLRAP